MVGCMLETLAVLCLCILIETLAVLETQSDEYKLKQLFELYGSFPPVSQFYALQVPTVESSGVLQVIINYLCHRVFRSFYCTETMFIQMLCKRVTKGGVPLSLAMSLLRPPTFMAKPHFKFANFCTKIAIPSTTPDRGVATKFLINKCFLTPEEIAKSFRHRSDFLRAKSSQNMEQVLELLNGFGLTTPAQIRKVIFRNTSIFLISAERNIQPKLSLLRAFMKEDHISKLIFVDPRILNLSEQKLRSSISLLQKLGVEGEALPEMLARRPLLLMASEEKVTELFKLAEDLGFTKGTKMFKIAIHSYFGLGKDKLDRKLQYFSSLGFSEQQVLHLARHRPPVVALSDEKLKRNIDFLVKTMGLSMADIFKYPDLIGCSLETRLIPRYRVTEAFKSMQVQVSKKSGPSLREISSLTEKLFLEKFVNLDAEFSSVLQDIHYKAKAGKLIISKGDLQ